MRPGPAMVLAFVVYFVISGWLSKRFGFVIGRLVIPSLTIGYVLKAFRLM